MAAEPGASTSVAPIAPSRPKTPILIGSVGQLSGPLGSQMVPLIRGAQAWVRMANDRGLANGHPIRYELADDGGDPARHKAQVQDMVERKKILAIVALVAPISGYASFDYLNKAGVPVIGSEGGSDFFYQSPTYFPQKPHGLALLQSTAAAMEVLPRGTKVALIHCVEVKFCDDSYNYWPKIAQSYGLNVVFRARATIAQPDLTAECLSARQAGAEAMAAALAAPTINRLVASCARQGYRPKFFYYALNTTPDQPKDPNFQGAELSSDMAPWFLTSTPAQQEFHTAMAQYAPGQELLGTPIAGWISAKLFGLAAANLPEPPTREALLDGLYSIRNNDLGGLTSPLTFTRGKPAQPVVCWWRVTVKNNDFVSPDGGARHCADVIPL